MNHRNKFFSIFTLFVTITSFSFAESEEYIRAFADFKDRFREYALTAHEKSKDENKELIESIIKESFHYVPGIENFKAMLTYKIGYYFEEYEGKFFIVRIRFLDPNNRDIIGFSPLFGDIVDTEERQVPITNPSLADIVGESMTWRAAYFIEENIGLSEIRGETDTPSSYTRLNFEDKMTAYVNISHFPKDIDAHEMMHIWQYEQGKDDDAFIFPVYNEFQAMAFDLAFNAYADTNQPLKNIIWAMNVPSIYSFYYRAGKYFKAFFEEEGYTETELYKMSPAEREHYGLELLQLYEEHGQDLF